MNNNLFEGSDDEGADLQLTTNKDYAKSYNILRKKELLQKYKDRGLDVSESELDSDSSDSSDEDNEDVKFDQEFFKTLSSLKSKDPKIYDKETKFFNDEDGDDDEEDADEEDDVSGKKKVKKSKPVTLKDYERKVILENNGRFEEDDEDENVGDQDQEERRPLSPSAVEEERQLKNAFKEVLADDDESDEEFGRIFKKRDKSKAEAEKEDKDFASWLAGKQADLQEQDKEQLEPLKNYWSSKKLTQGESFLRDYILNKGYAKANASEIPTYDEIVGESTPPRSFSDAEDEQELSKQAEFEHKYNFRFEEPDAEFVKRYPRTIEQSLRRTDDKRKEKRRELKERKEQEKHTKMKELEIIKEMKRKEIDEKIRKLKAVTGNDELGFKDEELEEDFDPQEHDRRMQEMFNDEYYDVDEGEEKPECPSDIEELAIEDWDNYDPKRSTDDGDGDAHCEDEDFNMDCDYDPMSAKDKLQQELIESSRKRRKGRRNRFREMIQADKPAFKPEDEKTYGEYIDEYYQLDCEDIIGDQPCRFKYVETTPNDFGLTIEEILLAKNKELNQWASLKKAVQLRPEHVEKKEQRLYKMKAKNEELKRKIFKSLYGDSSDEEEKAEEVPQPQAQQIETPTEPTVTENISKSKRKRLKRKAAAQEKVNNNKKPKENDETSTNGETKTEQTTESPAKSPSKLEISKPIEAPKSKPTKSEKKVETKPGKIRPPPTSSNPKNAKTNGVNPFKKATSAGVAGRMPLKKDQQFKAKNKFRNQKNNNNNQRREAGGAVTDDRLKAYGINPRKFHKREKYGKKAN
ncbi:uncharacterized protein Dwil_GK16643 [Drosophila willistoni]|uniref:Protein KRI1 homolog n=1 Tax=Drosophila willistoni TaxID=7260 RepID=B4MMN7_DROWI|nr:protein KRI1 homolog [Drosophila willistoni]EDW73443.1 uncharacterized protein Dwil_GK16643 [Drosophila willistoni]